MFLFAFPKGSLTVIQNDQPMAQTYIMLSELRTLLGSGSCVAPVQEINQVFLHCCFFDLTFLLDPDRMHY